MHNVPRLFLAKRSLFIYWYRDFFYVRQLIMRVLILERKFANEQHRLVFHAAESTVLTV